MDFWRLVECIKDFPEGRSNTIIRVLIWVIILCIIWWLLELLIYWTSSSDSAFRTIAENAIFVSLCFYWLRWLTKAANDMEATLTNRWKVLKLLSDNYSDKDTIKVQQILDNEKFFKELGELFSSHKWDRINLWKDLRRCLRQLAEEKEINKIDQSTYSLKK